MPSLQPALEFSRRSRGCIYLWLGRSRRARVRVPRQDFWKLMKMSVKSGKGRNTGRGFEVPERARVPKGLGGATVRVDSRRPEWARQESPRVGFSTVLQWGGSCHKGHRGTTSKSLLKPQGCPVEKSKALTLRLGQPQHRSVAHKALRRQAPRHASDTHSSILNFGVVGNVLSLPPPLTQTPWQGPHGL